jgi:type I restriction enzyme S subunit
MSNIEKKKVLVPKLRFKGFDEKWDLKKIGEISNVSAGGTPSTLKKEYWGGEIRWMNSGELNLKIVREVENRITEEGLKNSSTKLIPIKCILIGLAGQGKTRGTAAMNLVELCVNQSIAAIFPNNSKYIPEYLYQNIDFRYDELRSLSTGGGGRGGLNLQIIKSFIVPIPTLPEQQKIASFLSAIDEKIQQLTRKKELLEQYKKGVMQLLFSGKLRFKDENGKEFPEWVEKKIKEVLEIGSGRDYKHLSEGDIPVFGTGGLMTKVNEFLHDGETVCIGRKGTIDKPMYYSGKIWTVDTLFYTHKFKNSNPKFIYFLFQQINWKLYNEASGVPSLSKATIEKLKFSFPCIEEQKKIADYLSNIDNKIESVTKQITQTQIFKKGLLQQMFV